MWGERAPYADRGVSVFLTTSLLWEIAHSPNGGTSALVSSASLPDNVQIPWEPLTFWGLHLGIESIAPEAG